jgi:hypothetical protein
MKCPNANPCYRVKEDNSVSVEFCFGDTEIVAWAFLRILQFAFKRV